jgi:hypothetical protein
MSQRQSKQIGTTNQVVTGLCGLREEEDVD